MESTFTQVGLYYDPDREANAEKGVMKNIAGMCYVMRLEDGSFIVIDGGFDEAYNADRLYSTLEHQAPDPENIVIAAWIFTHDHGDHVGVLRRFAQKYKTEVTVEKFIHSFPFSSGESHISAMRGFSGAKIYKSHAGQKYYLRNAEIEILYTTDLYLDNVETMDDTNKASQVFTISSHGTKFMMFGDYYHGKDETVSTIYSNATLESHVMQHAHHGVSDASNKVVLTVAPTYVFWPTGMNMEKVGKIEAGYVCWEENGKIIRLNLMAMDQNKYVVEQIAKGNTFIASDDVYVATFKNGVLDVTHYENFDSFLSGTSVE